MAKAIKKLFNDRPECVMTVPEGESLNNNLHKYRPLLIIISIGIVGLIVAAVLAGGAGDRVSIVNAEFGQSSLQPGGSTSLTIRIKNMSSTTDAHNISVTLIPSDPTAVHVENGEMVVNILGAGEERVIEFSVSVSQNALPGKYKLKVSTSAGGIFQGENRDLYIDVVGA